VGRLQTGVEGRMKESKKKKLRKVFQVGVILFIITSLILPGAALFFETNSLLPVLYIYICIAGYLWCLTKILFWVDDFHDWLKEEGEEG
jgi:hypothetical protein